MAWPQLRAAAELPPPLLGCVQGNADLKWGLPAVPTRPASATEPRQYLDQPSFSTCTVPVLFYQHNAFNFAHTFRGGRC